MVKADSLKIDKILIQCSDAIQTPDLKVDFQILFFDGHLKMEHSTAWHTFTI